MIFDLGQHSPDKGEIVLAAQVPSQLTTLPLLPAQTHQDPSSLMIPVARRGLGDLLPLPLTNHPPEMIPAPSEGLQSAE